MYSFFLAMVTCWSMNSRLIEAMLMPNSFIIFPYHSCFLLFISIDRSLLTTWTGCFKWPCHIIFVVFAVIIYTVLEYIFHGSLLGAQKGGKGLIS